MQTTGYFYAAIYELLHTYKLQCDNNTKKTKENGKEMPCLKINKDKHILQHYRGM